MGFLSDCLLCFTLGITGEYNRYLMEEEKKKQQVNKKITIVIEEKKEVPFYIEDEMKALKEQIKINMELIDAYRWKEQIAMKEEDTLKWKKKRIDTEYKVVTLDKKLYKLIEKYNIDAY